jgi:hypothetical protein
VQSVEPVLAAVPPLPEEPAQYTSPVVPTEAPAWPTYVQNGAAPAPLDNPHWS